VGCDSAIGLELPSGRALCAALKTALVLRRPGIVAADRAVGVGASADGRDLG
jgi:hypothetical protein